MVEVMEVAMEVEDVVEAEAEAEVEGEGEVEEEEVGRTGLILSGGSRGSWRSLQQKDRRSS